MKKLFSGLTLGVLLAGLTGIAQADTITLTGTVRDFHSGAGPALGSPWFEGAIDNLVTGLVKTTLGPSKNPERTNKTTPSMPGDQSFFNTWFNDAAGINLSATLPLTLTQVGETNVYTYSDPSFFPIDGQLFGNEGNGHNYHFTYEIHTNFTYTGGEAFTFTGDDDVWVYINNQLVIDLGGVHGAQSATVQLSSLGLTSGQQYDFDLFFAERHWSQSNFSISTSIGLNPVPEPTTMLLFGTGIAGLAAARRRKKAC